MNDRAILQEHVKLTRRYFLRYGSAVLGLPAFAAIGAEQKYPQPLAAGSRSESPGHSTKKARR